MTAYNRRLVTWRFDEYGICPAATRAVKRVVGMNATRRIEFALRAFIAPMLFCGMALAQDVGAPIIGDWSGQTSGADGLRRYAMTITRDETYVWIVKLPNGVIQKTWGKWQILTLNRSEASVVFRSQGWLPLQTCSKGNGPLQRCKPYFLPATPSPSTLRFPTAGPAPGSPGPRSKEFKLTSFQLDGAGWTRDPAPSSLLQEIVRDHQQLNSGQPAARPGMPQPRKYGIPP